MDLPEYRYGDDKEQIKINYRTICELIVRINKLEVKLLDLLKDKKLKNIEKE